MRVRNLSGPHASVLLNLSLGSCSLLRTGIVSVWEKEEQTGAGSRAVQGTEEIFTPSSREEPDLDKTSE